MNGDQFETHPAPDGNGVVNGDDHEEVERYQAEHFADADGDGKADLAPEPQAVTDTVPVPRRWTRAFWVDLGERTLSTFLQTFGGTIPASALLLEDVDWPLVLSASALAGVIAAAKAVVKALPAE